MYCKNCGSEIGAPDRFCPFCGSPVNPAAVTASDTSPQVPDQEMPSGAPASMNESQEVPALAEPQEAVPSPVPQDAPSPAESPETIPSAEPQEAPVSADPREATASEESQESLSSAEPQEAPFEASESPQPEKKKRIPLPLVILLLVLAAAAALLLGPFKQVIKRLTMSPDEYFRYVVEKSLDEDLKAFDRYDGNAVQKALESGNAGPRYDFTLEMSETLTDLLSQSLNGYDLSFLKNISFSVDTVNGDAAGKKAISLVVNSTELLAMEVLTDDNKKMLMGIPTISEMYLDLLSIPGMEEQLAPMLKRSGASAFTKEIVKTLPDAEAYKSWARHYAEPVYMPIAGVTKTKGELIMDGQSPKCTLLHAVITAEMREEILKGLVEALKNDNVIESVMDYYSEVSPDMGKEFYDSLNQITDQDIKDAAAKIKSSELMLYVGRKDKIIGADLDITYDGESATNCLHINSSDIDGEKRFCLTRTEGAGEALRIEGGGTARKGHYIVESNVGTSFSCAVDFEADFGASYPRHYSLIVSDIRTDGSTGLGTVGDLLLRNYSFKFEGTNESSTNGNLAISVFDSKGDLVKLTTAVSYTQGDKAAITFPAEENVIELSDTQAALMQYLASADFTPLFGNLRNAGIPEELVKSVESYIGILKMYM